MATFERSAENAEFWNKRMDVPMVLVSALVIPAILLEVAATSESAKAAGFALNWMIWLAFIVEYAIGLKVAPDRRRFMKTHLLDAAIIVFTVPLLPAEASSLRLLRLLRLTRLLRLKPLIVWLIENTGARYVAGFAASVVLISGLAFSQLESVSFGSGIYWAVSTVTTVGYGDVMPTHGETRVLASVVMVIGVATFAALSAILAGRIIGRQEAASDKNLNMHLASLQADVQLLSEQVRQLSASAASIRSQDDRTLSSDDELD